MEVQRVDYTIMRTDGPVNVSDEHVATCKFIDENKEILPENIKSLMRDKIITHYYVPCEEFDIIHTELQPQVFVKDQINFYFTDNVTLAFQLNKLL